MARPHVAWRHCPLLHKSPQPPLRLISGLLCHEPRVVSPLHRLPFPASWRGSVVLLWRILAVWLSVLDKTISNTDMSTVVGGGNKQTRGTFVRMVTFLAELQQLLGDL